jgi:hypothetical protein
MRCYVVLFWTDPGHGHGVGANIVHSFLERSEWHFLVVEKKVMVIIEYLLFESVP